MRGQLEPERKPVEAGGDLAERMRLFGSRRREAGALDEQPDGVPLRLGPDRVRSGQRQRRHYQDVLTTDPQRLAARCEHVCRLGARQHAPGERRRLVDDVLAIVQDDRGSAHRADG